MRRIQQKNKKQSKQTRRNQDIDRQKESQRKIEKRNKQNED